MFSLLIPALTLLTLLGCGVMAGLFFAYSNSVMPALAKLPGPQGLAAMKHMNLVILNPLFLTIFMGTGVLALLLAVAALLGWTEEPARILVGAALYLLGSIAVTFGINVPMNNALAASALEGKASEALWASFLDRWVSWNHARTMASIGALAAFAMAMR